MAKKVFTFTQRVYLGDTNIFGNVYFANYFYWQGTAREEFFRQLIPDPMFFVHRNIRVVTIEAHMRFKKEALLFDEIEINVKPANPKTVTFDLLFIFISKKNGEVIAEGSQKIGFVNAKDYSVIPIPRELVRKGMAYL